MTRPLEPDERADANVRAPQQLIDLIDALDETGAKLPGPVAEAVTRWRALAALDVPERDPKRVPGVQAAAATTIAAAAPAGDLAAVVAEQVAAVMTAAAEDAREPVRRRIVTDAMAQAAGQFWQALTDQEAEVFAALQARHAVLVKKLAKAAAEVPEGFTSEAVTFAAPELVSAWRAAAEPAPQLNSLVRARALLEQRNSRRALRDLHPGALGHWLAYSDGADVGGADPRNRGQDQPRPSYYEREGTPEFWVDIARAVGAEHLVLLSAPERDALARRLWPSKSMEERAAAHADLRGVSVY